jgi:hypothetical protein
MKILSADMQPDRWTDRQVDMVMLIDTFFKLSIVNIPNIVIMAE